MCYYEEMLNRADTLSLSALLLLALAGVARADYQAVYLDDKPDARYLVQKIHRLVEKRRWDEAVQELQKMIVEHPGVVFQTGAHQYQGVRRHGMAMLLELPAEVRAAYQRRYDPRARALLRVAAGEAELKQIAGRYLFTAAADEAIERLAALSLERGEAAQAAYWLQQLLLKSPPEAIDPAALAQLGFCYREAAMVEPLRELAARCAELARPVRVGSARRMLPDYLRGLLAEAEADSRRLWNMESWPVLCGDWSQSQLAPFDVTARQVRWTHRFPVDISDWKYPGWRPEPLYRGQPPVRHHPVVGGGAVYVSNGQMVYAMSLLGGEKLWEAGPLVREIDTPQGLLQPYAVTYHRGSVYANLEVRSRGRSEVWMGRYQISIPIPMRVLVRIDAATGKVRWSSARPAEGRDAAPNRITLLSPPVIRGNVAYVPGTFYEGYFKYYLLAFDTRDGRLLWKRRIGGGQEALNLFGRPFRELTGSMPALSGGRLFLCSNLGFAACLDAETGEILWVARYDRLPIPTTQTHHLPSVDITWFSRPPLVAGGLVLVAPVDSRFLYAYEAATGRLRWAVPAHGDKVLLGVSGGKVFTAGTSLRAFHLASGKLALAPRQLGIGEGSVIGLGALTEKSGYVCTSNTLYRFSTADLELLDRTHPPVRGNVLLVGNVRLLAGTGRLAGSYDWDEFQRNLSGLIARAPDEPFAYNGLAAIHAQRGEFDPAREHYQRALERAAAETSPEHRQAARRARAGLYTLYLKRARQRQVTGQVALAMDDLEQAERHALGDSARLWVLQLRLKLLAARGDLAAVAALVERIDEQHGAAVIAVANRRTTAGLAALVRLARLYAQAGRAEQAVGVYMRILARHPHVEYEGANGGELAYKAIEALKKLHDPSVYGKWDAEARQRFAQAQRSGSIRELEAIRSRYPNCSILPDVTLLMARRLIDAGRAEEAKNLLQGFLRTAREDERQPLARFLLFKALDASKLHAAAKGILLELVEQYDGVKLELGDERIDLGEFARRRLAEKRYELLDARPPLRRLVLPAGAERPVWQMPLPGAGARLIEPAGACPRAFLDRFFVEDGGQLACRRSEDGKELWSVRAGVRVQGLAWNDDTLIVWLREGIIAAYDAEGGRRLWQQQTGGDRRSVRVGRGLVAIAQQEGDPRRRTSRMLLLDARTGRIAWSSPFPAVSVPPPLFARRHLVAWSVDRPGRVFLFELATGRWSEPFKLGLEGLISAPVLFGDDRLALPLSKKKLLIHDLVRSRAVRTIEVADGIRDFMGLFAGPRVLLVATGADELEAYSPAGRRLWRARLEQQRIRLREVVDDEAYLVTVGELGGGGQSQQVVAFDTKSGNIRWQAWVADARTPVWWSAVTQDQLVLQMGYRDALKLLVIDRRTGKRIVQWPANDRRRALPPVLAGGRLVCLSGEMLRAYGGARPARSDK